MNGTLKVQHNFMIPESIQITKGANTIVSYLQYFLENHDCGEKHLFLHADNCVAQNKNNIMIGYLVWRIINGLNDIITLSFLPVGHTTFSCDWAFGLLKKKFRKSKVSSLSQLEEVIQSSTPSGLNQTVKTGTVKGDVLVPLYDWMTYFHVKGWKVCNRITKYLHFYFHSNDKGIVETKLCLEGATVKNRITFQTDAIGDSPKVIEPVMMTKKRKQYLYDKIRPYCEENFKDVLCPHPGNADEETEQPGETTANVDEPTPQPSPKTPKPKKDQENPKRKTIQLKNKSSLDKNRFLNSFQTV